MNSFCIYFFVCQDGCVRSKFLIVRVVLIDKPDKMIDVHCHLADNKFKDDLEEVIRSAMAAGVEKIVVVPEFESQFEKIFEMSRNHPGIVYAGIGVHPIQVKLFLFDFH